MGSFMLSFVSYRGIEAFAIEIDKSAAELCKQNLKANKLQATIFNNDLTDNIEELENVLFDHVFMNPPFFKKDSVKTSSNQSSDRAKVETVALSVWISIAMKQCKPNGKITIIQRVDRLPDIVVSKGQFGCITVQPLSSFEYTEPKTIIVRQQNAAELLSSCSDQK